MNTQKGTSKRSTAARVELSSLASHGLGMHLLDQLSSAHLTYIYIYVYMFICIHIYIYAGELFRRAFCRCLESSLLHHRFLEKCFWLQPEAKWELVAVPPREAVPVPPRWAKQKQKSGTGTNSQVVRELIFFSRCVFPMFDETTCTNSFQKSWKPIQAHRRYGN